MVTCKKHWTGFIPTGIIAVAVAAVGIAAGRSAGNPATIAGCIVIAVVLLAGDILATGHTRLTISASGVEGRTGVLHRKKITAPIHTVQDVTVSAGVLGKLLGSYTIIVTTAGTGAQEIVFKGFTHGPEFQQTYLRLAK